MTTGDMSKFYDAAAKARDLFVQDELKKQQELRDANAERSHSIQEELDRETKAWEKNAQDAAAVVEETLKLRTNAEKGYLKALEDIAKAEHEAADMERDYAENIMGAGRDVGAIRSLTTQHRRDERVSVEKLGVLQSEVGIAGSKYTAAGGTPEMFAVTIQNVNLSKDYPWKNFMDDVHKEMEKSRKQQGVRTAR